MSHEEVFVSVAVKVTGVDPHTSLGRAFGVDRGAGQGRLVFERAVTLVNPQLIGIGVVGHVYIAPAIRVEIGRHYAEGPAESGGNL